MKALCNESRLMHMENEVVNETNFLLTYASSPYDFQSAQAGALEDRIASVSLQLLKFTFKDFCYADFSPTQGEQRVSSARKMRSLRAKFLRSTHKCATCSAIWNRKNGNWKNSLARALLETGLGSRCFWQLLFIGALPRCQTTSECFRRKNSFFSRSLHFYRRLTIGNGIDFERSR